MTSRSLSFGTLGLLFGAAALLSAGLQAAILDVGLTRTRGASVTTELPGYVYASATLLKVWMVGGLIGLFGMLRRERPLAGFGVLLHSVVLGLCWYLQFYAAGFDQDGWAPRAF